MATVNSINVNGTMFDIEDTEARGDIATTQVELSTTTGTANEAKSKADTNAAAITTLQNVVSTHSTQIASINTALAGKLNKWGGLSTNKVVPTGATEDLTASEVADLINATASELSTGNKILLLCNGSYDGDTFSTAAVIAQWNGSYFVAISNPLQDFLEFNTDGTIAIGGGSTEATRFFAVGAVIA